MVLHQSKIYMKCHKPKYFCVIFHFVKTSSKKKKKIFKFNYVIEIITRTIFNTDLLEFMILNFYIFIQYVFFSFDLCSA